MIQKQPKHIIQSNQQYNGDVRDFLLEKKNNKTIEVPLHLFCRQILVPLKMSPANHMRSLEDHFPSSFQIGYMVASTAREKDLVYHLFLVLKLMAPVFIVIRQFGTG